MQSQTKDNPYVKISRRSASPLWRNKQPPLLSMLDIELTERCNINCIHCYINLPEDSINAKERELSCEEIKGILTEAVGLGCLTVRFTGGEPLLREDFRELYVFARRLGLRVLIFTNATLINRLTAELFASIPPLFRIEVSVYGMKKHSYEAATRIPGSFEAFQQGIALLLKYRVPFVVKSAVLPSNKDEMDKFEAWAATIPWMDSPPEYSMFFDAYCRGANQERNRIIRGIRLSAEQGLSILRRRKDYINKRKQFCSKFMFPAGDRLFSCGAGYGGWVDAYGKYQLCMHLRHPDTVYDLRTGSLKEALITFSPRIRELKASNPVYLERCAKCFLKGLCRQCPGRSWVEDRTLDTPIEYHCEIAHAEARFLGLLKENEKGWQVVDWRERIREFVDS